MVLIMRVTDDGKIYYCGYNICTSIVLLVDTCIGG